MASRKAQKKKARRRTSAALTIVSFVVLVCCIGYLWNEIAMYKRTTQVVNSVRDTYNSGTASAQAAADPTETAAPVLTDAPTEAPSAVPAQPKETAAPTAAPTDAPEPTEEPGPVLQERFVQLYEQNNELVGWIKVNEKIEYPIVWKEGDNDFYMDHDYDGNESIAGWIFLDKRNVPEMTDDHMLIYGHNMRNNEMFGLLDEYRYLDHIKKNPIIEIQNAWEAEPKKYVIISLFDASMNKSDKSYIKITHFNFETPEEKQEFIDKMRKKSMYKLPVEAGAEDQLVTLVTCEYSHANGRYLVMARELREDETEEQIRETFTNMK